MGKIASKDMKWLNKFTDDEIVQFVNIGFCQPKFYRPEVWRKAKRVMEIACSLGLAEPYDFGRGKGKYTSDLDMSEVSAKLLKIVKRYGM